jgi:hypothetical protein
MRTSNKRPSKGLHNGPHRGLHKELHKEFPKGLDKEFRKELHKGLHTLVCQGARKTCSTSSQKLTTRTCIHSYMHTYIHTYTHICTYIHASWRPSGAMWARTEPRGPKRHPQSLLETIWGRVGPNRAGRPQTTSTEPPGRHLGPCGLQPGREAPNGFHRVSWKPFGVLWAPTGPGGPKRLPQGLLETTWGPVGPSRAWRPRTLDCHTCE